jgi:hypothetical protein
MGIGSGKAGWIPNPSIVDESDLQKRFVGAKNRVKPQGRGNQRERLSFLKFAPWRIIAA